MSASLRVDEALASLPPHGLAIVDADGTEHRWGDLRRGAQVGAASFGDVAPGDRVGLLVAPGARWVSSLLALWRRGAVAVPLSPLHPPRERARLLAEVRARHWVVDPEHRCPEVGATALVPAPTSGPDGDGGSSFSVETREERALILFTSGTTGRPKGAQLTHRQLAHQGQLLGRAWRLGPETRLLHALPLHHMHGIAIALLPTLQAGGAARCLPRFDAETVWERFSSVDVFMGVPAMYHRLLARYDAAPPERQRAWRAGATALTLCTSGSAALPITLAARWRAIHGHIPLERYGMTEIGVGCSNPFDPDARRRGTVGPPLPTQSMRIVDGAGRDTDEGEVWVKGPSVFAGYFERPEANREAFVDGWFKTGDVGRFEADGSLRLLGRRSVDIIKSGGYKLSALEIEEALRDHPAVADVAVVGVPSEAWGEAAIAVVVPAREASADDLRTWCKDHLAAYKVPRVVTFVDALPRNALGKVQKPALRDTLAKSNLTG
ncbi:MAG: AMP-binding protein [Myxococcota bacterium]